MVNTGCANINLVGLNSYITWRRLMCYQ